MRKLNVLSRVIQTGNPQRLGPDDFVRRQMPVILVDNGEAAPLTLAHQSGIELTREDLKALLAVELNRKEPVT